MSQQSDVKVRVMDHDSRYESEGKGNSPGWLGCEKVSWERRQERGKEG